MIEQAKGVLIERLDLPAEDVFDLILKTRVTPGYIRRETEHLLERRA